MWVASPWPQWRRAAGVLPYSCNLEALRRIPPRVFGVLTSLEPAAGALFGLLILAQRLAWPQWLGIGAVALASVAATFVGAEERPSPRVSAKDGPPQGTRPSRIEGACSAVPVE
jgi:inner membrane transporter RhtA